MDMTSPVHRCISTLAWLLFAIGSKAGLAANDYPIEPGTASLVDLEIEQLLDLDISSITKTSSNSKKVPAALFVLNHEDILRTGATSIPEALRMVPGLHVAKINGGGWSVSVRGINSQFGDPLLVLVDGRSVYTPLFSGTWWDQIDVLMEDIERIEVIRGPGTSLWGANAVNGVINIVTQSAQQAKGMLASAYYGSERYGGGLRYGTDLGDGGFLKVFARHGAFDDSRARGSRENAGDSAGMSKLGFRFDKDVQGGHKLMLQGNAFIGESGGANQTFPAMNGPDKPAITPPYSVQLPTEQNFHGHSILARWESQQSADSTTALRFYWDQHSRRINSIDANNQVDTVDIDFQHNLRLNAAHMLVWGSGYRVNSSHTDEEIYLSLNPSERTDRIYSVFVQDEITLVPNKWTLTLGSKFEHNPVTQFETEPNIRLSWTPDERHTLWSAVSRAVRLPNWLEQNVLFNGTILPPAGNGPATPINPAVLVRIRGNPDMSAEKMLAFEGGWRAQWTHNFHTDFNLYYYNYDDFHTYNPAKPDTSTLFSGYVTQTFEVGNYAFAQVYGGEINADWQIADDWKLRAGYSHAEDQFGISATMPSAIAASVGNYPANKASLWSMHELRPDLKLDLMWRFVDATAPSWLSAETVANRSYHEVDARLAWQLAPNLEISLIGRNLLDSVHFETTSYFTQVATGTQREVYATIRWQP